MSMSEYERVEALRREWDRGEEDCDSALCVAEPPASPLTYPRAVTLRVSGGIALHRCGGGRMVRRKRIGGD